jgi:Zn-dependent peptidase ImmA (M78 family)
MSAREIVRNINPGRVKWCMEDYAVGAEELSHSTKITTKTLNRLLSGEDILTPKQLGVLSGYFNRGMLFFLDEKPLKENKLHTAHFRTLTSQKPYLSHDIKTLIERLETHRQTYLSLLEEIGESPEAEWYPYHLKPSENDIGRLASSVRNWLGLEEKTDFANLRNRVEAKGILVVLSNPYAGRWQIPKENSIRGFSLYYSTLPAILVKKQASEGAQAFTLMHELGHLLLHRESNIDDAADIYSHKGKEKSANEFAGKVLVSDDLLKEPDDKIKKNKEILKDFSLLEKTFSGFSRKWCVSNEVILRRLSDSGLIPVAKYIEYRNWKEEQPEKEAPPGGGQRHRYGEPKRIFGEPYVRIVFDALQNKKISLAKASTCLDNLKITDLHKLEATIANIPF